MTGRIAAWTARLRVAEAVINLKTVKVIVTQPTSALTVYLAAIREWALPMTVEAVQLRQVQVLATMTKLEEVTSLCKPRSYPYFFS